MRVVLVDPDPEWAARAAAALRAVSVTVVAVGTAREAREAVAAGPCDVLVTAFGLPDGSGLALCRETAPTRTTPAIRHLVVTPTSAEAERVAAFEAGADDVLVRAEASARELALRVRALGRRRPSVSPAPPPAQPAFQLDEARGVVLVDGRAVPVTPTERAILEALAGRPGRVFDRSTLRRQVWGEEPVQERTVDSAVKRLRARLGSLGERIETVRGVGYRWSNLTNPREPDGL